mmetsp:Transcript_27660/g.69313  ORF Transcript_27660/g.69313 Transcript_27660/m.69313 type:complete len:206 (+) Transcript_27660:1280-1897(+)
MRAQRHAAKRQQQGRTQRRHEGRTRGVCRRRGGEPGRGGGLRASRPRPARRRGGPVTDPPVAHPSRGRTAVRNVAASRSHPRGLGTIPRWNEESHCASKPAGHHNDAGSNSHGGASIFSRNEHSQRFRGFAPRALLGIGWHPCHCLRRNVGTLHGSVSVGHFADRRESGRPQGATIRPSAHGRAGRRDAGQGGLRKERRGGPVKR